MGSLINSYKWRWSADFILMSVARSFTVNTQLTSPGYNQLANTLQVFTQVWICTSYVKLNANESSPLVVSWSQVQRFSWNAVLSSSCSLQAKLPFGFGRPVFVSGTLFPSTKQPYTNCEGPSSTSSLHYESPIAAELTEEPNTYLLRHLSCRGIATCYCKVMRMRTELCKLWTLIFKPVVC